ncbi:MAG: triose-phosphate isomerase [Phycisphaerae bacterium]
MARKLTIGGNWKMNTSMDEAIALAKGIAEKLGNETDVDVTVFPPYVYLAAVADVLKDTNVHVGAQNMFYEDNGAFTGEISSAMLKDIGCSTVLLGHSERRHVIGESDELINRKVVKALGDGLKVVLAIGELLEEREAGKTDEVNTRQIRRGLEGVSKADMANMTIAYEPVWAIGTGVTATPEQAQDTQASVRKLLADLYDDEVAEATRIQYGGSMKPANAAELLAQADIDGGLIGGASLKADSFAEIVAAGK